MKKINQINYVEFYARKTKDGRYQTLKDHLKNTAIFASKFDILGLKNTIYITAILHDIGKATNKFQDYLKNDGEKGKVFHSPIGAKIALKILKEKNINEFFAEAITMSISAHHSNLYDGLSPYGEREYLNILENVNEDELSITDFVKSHITQSLVNEVNQEIIYFLTKFKGVNEAPFFLNMVVRYIYSCLVDADRLDAKCFEKDNLIKRYSIDDFIESLEKYLKSFSKTSQINKYRQEVSNACLESSKKDIGIYTFEVPTGAGKTLASLRFALNHIKNHNLKRVIYVVPYLSIIEQTAKTFYEVLNISKNSGLILEHHSNFVPNKINMEKYRFLESCWDSPIIITTAVQFLESVFSNKASNIRKLHNIAESVIIFDEIQSLPPKCFFLFNNLANFLSIYCKTTIILCSATQIPLYKVKKPIMFNNNLISPVKTILPKRTKIVLNTEKPLTYEDISKKAMVEIEFSNSALIITNTKKDALKIYEELLKINDKNFALYYLSTLLCPKHRLDVIANIKNDLKKCRKTICVSTQLIEAGVDISFGCVIRAQAGLDSIIQASGRCNRSGEFKEEKNVYVVKIKDENLLKLPEIKSNSNITDALINCDKYNNDLSSFESISKYYEQFLKENENKFEYNLKDGITIYDLLSLNMKGNRAFENKYGKLTQKPTVRASFKTASEEFFLIDKGGQSVFVPFDQKAERLISELSNSEKINEIFLKLSQYSVSLFDYQIENLKKANAIVEINDFFTLKKEFYDKDIGIKFFSDDCTLIV